MSIIVSGENAPVIGVRRLLYEIAYNLCDNAIKYNADGGSVDVRVGAEGGSACLTVRDTGIGIPPEHQSRIFERFYRVDKSHSKASGGTGLGLSIVKHAVAVPPWHDRAQKRGRQGHGDRRPLPAGKITASKRERADALSRFCSFHSCHAAQRSRHETVSFHEIGAADVGKPCTGFRAVIG